MTVLDLARLQAQTDEFDTLAALIKTFNALPAVVDDDYPRARHFYESALRTFIDALEANGRVKRVTGTVSMHYYMPDLQAQGDCRVCGHGRETPWHMHTRYEIAHDGFNGVVIGDYRTLEGKEGVVLQQIGTRVVHVYGKQWLKESA
ncbi:hypothetical protein [Bradyrhizobium lablabi]|nr:hypothetical protein [Bradyrhizobium lablabi]